MTEIEVATMLDMIKDCHQNFTITDSTIKTWYMLFSEYECESIMASARKYLRTNEYCPVPASILKLYKEGKSKIDSAIGKDIEELMMILTFIVVDNVADDVEYYREWIKTVPEIDRIKKSHEIIRSLKEMDYFEKFNFKKWLKNNWWLK